MHRRLPIVDPADAGALGADGVVIANINPARVDDVARGVAAHFAGPILRLWEPRYLPAPGRFPAPGM